MAIYRTDVAGYARRNNLGQTIQEAHAAGLPVVAPRAGGPIDLVAHGDDGFLFAPDDERELRRFVGRLAADGALRQRMGEAGRRSVLGRSWDSVCRTLLDYYESAIDERAAVWAGTLVPVSMQRQDCRVGKKGGADT